METWKDIIGYEGLYSVSSEGRILAHPREVLKKMYGGEVHTYYRKSRYMRLDNVKGYRQVQLSKNNTRVRMRVHRIVAAAFLLNPLNKPIINHKDSNRANNSVDNLEWCSVKENVDHMIQNGRSKHLENILLAQHANKRLSARRRGKDKKPRKSRKNSPSCLGS